MAYPSSNSKNNNNYTTPPQKQTMKIQITNSRTIKPLDEGNPSPRKTTHTPLTVFDKVTFDQHIPLIYAYRSPTPRTDTIELGLRKTLSVYREWAGRLGTDTEGNPVILLNDEGVKFVEAKADEALDVSSITKPSRSLLALHPSLDNVVELMQVQVTRFSCGSMVIGFTGHHLVADGHATSDFFVAWGRACRGVDMSPLPLCDHTIFSPRNPSKIGFDHVGVEYVTKKFAQIYPLINYDKVDNIVVHKVCYKSEFLSELKHRASVRNRESKPYTTFECLVAHLWKAITKARGMNGSEITRVKIGVDGRARLNPKVPDEYFGNLVLWAFARSEANDVLSQPLSYAARVLHEAIDRMDDHYFKSFIDFSFKSNVKEDLVPKTRVETYKTVLSPDLEIDSWLRFPFHELDFGGGTPFLFMPSFLPIEGVVILLPSCARDGSVEAFVPLFEESLKIFKEISHSLD